MMKAINKKMEAINNDLLNVAEDHEPVIETEATAETSTETMETSAGDPDMSGQNLISNQEIITASVHKELTAEKDSAEEGDASSESSVEEIVITVASILDDIRSKYSSIKDILSPLSYHKTKVICILIILCVFLFIIISVA